MEKKFTESKAFNIILSVLIAVGLWLYVTTVVNNEGSAPVYNLPVTVRGEDVLLGKGMMIDPVSRLTVNLRLKGSRTTLANITANTAENLTATVDVSGVDAAGTYDLPVKVTVRSSVVSGAATVENRDSLTIPVSFFKMMTKPLDVRVVQTGSLPDGYRSNAAEVTPSTIRIQGPEAVVSQIQQARAVLNVDGLTKTFSGDLSIEYLNAAGVNIVGEDVVADSDSVNVILPVVKTQNVPLEVGFFYGGGITKENAEQYVTCTIDPPSIQISGDEADVNALEGSALHLGPLIDLASFTETQSFQLPIDLDPGLTNDSGITQAAVTVSVRGLGVRTLETSNIEIINLKGNYTATAVTQSLKIRVRGPADVLETLEGQQFRAVVDLSEETLRQGQFSFQAKIYSDADSSCGVISRKNENLVVVNIE